MRPAERGWAVIPLALLFLAFPALGHWGVDDGLVPAGADSSLLHLFSISIVAVALAGTTLFLALRTRRGSVDGVLNGLALLALAWIGLSVFPVTTSPANPAGSAVVLLFFLFLGVLLWRRARAPLRQALQSGKARALFLLVFVLLSAFYLLATGMVQPPERTLLGRPQSPAEGFIVPFEVFGPLTLWPAVEFWSPTLGLGGFISVGTGLVVVGLALLGASAVALQVSRPACRVALGGSLATGLATNACCCCAAPLLALLAPVLGGPVTLAISRPSFALNNAAMVGNLLLLLAVVLHLARRAGGTGTAPGGSESSPAVGSHG